MDTTRYVMSTRGRLPTKLGQHNVVCHGVAKLGRKRLAASAETNVRQAGFNVCIVPTVLCTGYALAKDFGLIQTGIVDLSHQTLRTPPPHTQKMAETNAMTTYH
jgi:hypothetical protein